MTRKKLPNPVPHIHHYVLKGSGLSCWAECDVLLSYAWEPWARQIIPCGEKLAGDNGPIVGSKAKVESAMP